MSFDELLERAKGSTVTFYGWGGDELLNRWLDEVFAPTMKEKYDITMERVPMDIDQILSQLSGEIQAVSQTIPVFELEGSTLVISRGIWGGGTGGGGGGGSAYILPAATAKRLGGVKIGDGIDVTTDGTISTDVTAVAEAAAAEMEKNTEEYTADEIQALFNGA